MSVSMSLTLCELLLELCETMVFGASSYAAKKRERWQVCHRYNHG